MSRVALIPKKTLEVLNWGMNYNEQIENKNDKNAQSSIRRQRKRNQETRRNETNRNIE